MGQQRSKFAKCWLKILHSCVRNFFSPVPIQNPNIVHYASLFEAEILDLQNDQVNAIRKYSASIHRARERNTIQDEALAEQRFGEFYLRQKNKPEARSHLLRSVRLYEEWGALAKAVQIRIKHKESLGDEEKPCGDTDMVASRLQYEHLLS